MKIIGKSLKLLIIFVFVFSLVKVNVEKDNGVVFNDNKNKVLDLTAMAIKMEEIRMIL